MYRKASNVDDLDATICFLEQTAALVEFFLDTLAIRSTADSRLEILQKVGKYFQDWQQSEGTSHTTNFITRECFLDLMSIVNGFQQIVRVKLAGHPMGYVCAANVNIDVVENFFSSHRAVNGCTNNPTTLQYSKSINTILISRKLVSTKSNAGGKVVVGGAKPFKLHVSQSFSRIRGPK